MAYVNDESDPPSEQWAPRPPTETGPHWVLTFGADEPMIAYAELTPTGIELFDREGDPIPAHQVALCGRRLVPPPLPGHTR